MIFFSFCKKVLLLLITLPKYFRFRIIRFFWHGSLRPSHQGKTLLDPLKGVHKVSHNGVKYFFNDHSYFYEFVFLLLFLQFLECLSVNVLQVSPEKNDPSEENSPILAVEK